MSVKWNSALLEQVRNAVMTGVIRGTERIITEADKAIRQGPKTGRIYRHRTITHQASAPGEAPASDLGKLRQSGHSQYNRNELSGQAIFSTAYAAALEFGTDKMEARPFLRPALANNKDAITDDVVKEVEKVLT